MKKNGIILLAAINIAVLIFAFKPSADDGAEKYMVVTTVESIIPMGLGRSKVLITYPDMGQEEAKLENFYSGVGINFGNIQQNDNDILQRINTLSSQGWELYNVSTGVQSPTDGGKQGIYLTRYLFRKG